MTQCCKACDWPHGKSCNMGSWLIDFWWCYTRIQAVKENEKMITKVSKKLLTSYWKVMVPSKCYSKLLAAVITLPITSY